MKKRIFTFSFAMCILFISFGQTQDSILDNQSLFEMDLVQLMEIEVITASKTAQSLSDAPATMIVITDKMIKDRGYHHLEEILHDLPGFDFNKNYGINYSTIFMRGYRSDNSDRFILMFDGIMENDIWKQTTWISRQYPVSQIKQIEVLYGPASALYGTNAFSGIINVITKKGDEVGDINLVTTAGSWGRKNIEFSTGKDVNKDLSYNITAKYFSQDDLHNWDDFNSIDGRNSNFSQSYLDLIGNKLQFLVDGKLIDGGFNENLPTEDYSIHANIKMGDLSFSALNWTKKEMEGYFYSPFKRSGRWTEWFEQNQGYMLSHNKEIGERITLSTDLTYRLHNILESQEIGFKYYTAPLTDNTDADYNHSQTINHQDFTTYQLKPIQVVLDNGDTSFVTGKVYSYLLKAWDLAFEEQIDFDVNEWLDITGGFRYTYTNTQEDYEVRTNNYTIVSPPRHNKKTIAGYGQAVLKPFKGFGLTIGGRYEDQKDEKLVGYSIFTPRISAIYNLNKTFIFRAQYAEAFQEADDWHKFATDYDIRPYNSSDLEPEKLKAIEFGLTAKIADKLIISGDFYRSLITNFISDVENTATNPYHGYTYGIHFENNTDGEVTITGYDIMFNAMIINSLSLNGNVSGSFNVDCDGDEIGDIAPLRINIGLLYNYNNKISFYPKLNYVSTKNTVNLNGDPNTDPIYKEIGGYGIVGLNVNILNTFGFVDGLDINLKINNAFNTEYYNPGSRSADGVKYSARVLQPGLNIMAGILYSF